MTTLSLQGTAIIYATSESNSQTYKELAKNIYMNDFVVVTEKKIEAVMEGVLGALKKVPRQVMEVHCGISPLEYEDYIPFGEETVYEIPYHFLQTTRDIQVEVCINLELHGPVLSTYAPRSTLPHERLQLSLKYTMSWARLRPGG